MQNDGAEDNAQIDLSSLAEDHASSHEHGSKFKVCQT